MPLLTIVRKLAISYMGNIIRAGELTRKDVIALAIKRFGLRAEDRADLLRDYRVAREMSDAAVSLKRPHNRTPDKSEFPRAPGDAAHKGRYRYEVLLTSTDPMTGEKSTTRGYYYSDVPQSLRDVRRTINESAAHDRDWITSPKPERDAPQSQTQSITVLSIAKVT